MNVISAVGEVIALVVINGINIQLALLADQRLDIDYYWHVLNIKKKLELIFALEAKEFYISHLKE
jgi:hypothetical protein